MTSPTYKLTTLIGESTEGIEDAVRTALATSAERVRGQEWCQVTDIRASIGGAGEVERWQVQVEVAFEVER